MAGRRIQFLSGDEAFVRSYKHSLPLTSPCRTSFACHASHPPAPKKGPLLHEPKSYLRKAEASAALKFLLPVRIAAEKGNADFRLHVGH